MNEIKIFENEKFGKVRTAGTSDEPLFCAIDICRALRYTNNRRAIELHVEKEDVTKCYAPTNGGEQELAFVTESGLYSLILGCKLPEAKAFKHWVTSEVLPSIRKTGQYSVFKVPQTFAEALRLAADQQEKIEAQQRQLEANATEIVALSNKVTEMQPKATYYDQILSSKNTILTTQIAKDYGYSAQKFNKLLESLHIQYRLRGQWLLYAEHAGNGYTKSVSIPFEYNDGTCGTRTQSEWTQRGRLFLYEKLKANNILPTIEK